MIGNYHLQLQIFYCLIFYTLLGLILLFIIKKNKPIYWRIQIGKLIFFFYNYYQKI